MAQRNPEFLMSSAPLDWRGVRLGRYALDPHMPEYVGEAADNFGIILVKSGTYLVHNKREDNQASAHYSPGAIGTTAPGHIDRLTRTATSPDPLIALQLALDRTFVESVAEQVGFVGRLDALDTLHLRDEPRWD